MAKCVEELQVWQRAETLAREVFAATEQPSFARHARLVEQVNESAASILANIAEGFGQGTDRAFAKFVGIARGSCNELRSHLAIASIRRCIPDDRRTALHHAADEISRMLTGLERYLLQSDRRRHG
jgi:four helix bundle protein